MKGLSDDLKLFALYLLTSPHRTIEGLFPLPVHYIVADLGWTANKVKKLLAGLEQIGFLKFDHETNLLLIRNALKYQFPENPNQISGAIRRIKDLPNSVLLIDLQELVRKHCYRKGTSSEVQGFPYLLDKALANRLPQPLGLPPSPPPPQAQTTTLSLTRRDGDGQDVCLSLAEGEVAKKELELRKKYPHLAGTG